MPVYSHMGRHAFLLTALPSKYICINPAKNWNISKLNAAIQAMPQLTDRSKLPHIVDPMIKDTMDLKHLYQVWYSAMIPLFVLNVQNILFFVRVDKLEYDHTGCCCSCVVCATRTQLPPADNRCFAFSCASCSCRAWRDTTSYTICTSRRRFSVLWSVIHNPSFMMLLQHLKGSGASSESKMGS